ncbi:MAG: hypothetical protein ACOZNI_01695 [Myxococcota bacterium]
MNLAPLFTFAAQSNPAGGAILSEILADTGVVEVGPTADVYFYWYELDVKLRKQILGGFLIPWVQVGWEPGWFIPASDPTGERTWSPHLIGRAGLVMNLRNDKWWLYEKVVGTTRDRRMREWDPYKAAELGDELSVRNDLALMYAVSRQDERVWWVYAELTVEAEREWGWLQKQPRVGLLVEEIAPHLSVDLDLNWSLMDTAIGGPGVLGVVWWAPPINGKRP